MNEESMFATGWICAAVMVVALFSFTAHSCSESSGLSRHQSTQQTLRQAHAETATTRLGVACIQSGGDWVRDECRHGDD